VLQIPPWVQEVSPFEHLALAPAEPFRLLPTLTVAGVAVVLSTAGQWAFARRDVPG
jgi:ABC-2 type transport system permease protein